MPRATAFGVPMHQLWDTGEITVDHRIEDEEWSGVEESREVAQGEALAEDFFKAGLRMR